MKSAIPTMLIGALLCAAASGGWQDDFPVDKKRLGPNGGNDYFVLTPGHKLHYKQGNNTMTAIVLNETKVIDGVECRVVEDREMKNGQLIEATRDYYAVDSQTKDVYYFGEDVDTYKHGKIKDHKGAWLSGEKGAKFGLIMPGTNKVGLKYFQEMAPGVAMDRAEVVAVGQTVTTPAGTFQNCVQTKESSTLERGTTHKWYAPGVGMVKEKEFVLVRIEK
ncbi:MAG: hypothetical protein HYZ37_04890 [Candidatus Solibacter usitatus]|nr:hypothetical protein [Candidatus Solibacter usitatus]